MNYDETVSYILNIPKFTKKNGLEHTRELLDRLSNPQDSMKVIHVAGTNGKGSVCAFVNGILLESGQTVGMFTSPHLETLNERFRINGCVVSDEDFIEASETVLCAVHQMQREKKPHPTFFEFLFAMAMVLFQKFRVEYAVLETGLGGRLDATNVVKHPAVTVITSIGLDHTQILGDTLEQIASEKAGIIKTGVPVIYDSSRQCTAAVIEETAKKRCAPVYPVERKILTNLLNTDKTVDFSYYSRYYGNIDISVENVAMYQALNAALAVRAVEQIDRGRKLHAVAIRDGIRKTRWPGRMEQVLPGVILDGAHNEDGICGFLETVRNLGKRGKRVLLFSAVQDKQVDRMIEDICISNLFDVFVLTQLSDNRGLPIQKLKEEFSSATEKTILTAPDAEAAFLEARRQMGDGILFCVGSLYLVGELKKVIRRQSPC